MIEVRKKIFTWLVGGSLYYTMEIMMRGYSHISMFALGGVCFLLVGAMGKRILEKIEVPSLAICLIMFFGTLIITSLEFVTGIVVNVIFDLKVWDYSEMRYNVYGQICPVFSVLWALISLPCVYIDSMIRKCIYREEVEYIKSLEKQ
ncbi:MAG: hypothetical protein IJX12_02745 [Lachnospiraceae bacterium]|nr:hypothetical protein [Lachnospiraceae bacterium]